MALALRIARISCGSKTRCTPISSSIQFVRFSSSSDDPLTPAQKPVPQQPAPQNPASQQPAPQQSAPQQPASQKCVEPQAEQCVPVRKKYIAEQLKESTGGQVRENFKDYFYGRLFAYVKNYDKVLEKNFPTAVNVYRLFFDGMKEFFQDMKKYFKISRIANESPSGPKALNRKELELYMKMPRDMVKVTPAILLSSLPVVGYMAFPLAYMFPRALLSSHFWTLQQKSEFQQLDLCERLKNNRPVFRQLQRLLVKSKGKNERHKEIDKILGLVGSGFHPTVEQLLEAKDGFANPPYHFNSLSSKHIKHLALMYGVPGAFFLRHRMAELAYIIHFMDLAIMREGDVHNMPKEAIQYACFIRGLNPTNLSNEQMIEWLRNWVKVSMALREEHMSLFLHLPIFLGYNHPNNWHLIYGKKK